MSSYVDTVVEIVTDCCIYGSVSSLPIITILVTTQSLIRRLEVGLQSSYNRLVLPYKWKHQCGKIVNKYSDF